MNALEQAAAYANDAECPVVAKGHILALLEMARKKNDLISAHCVAHLYEGEFGSRLSFYDGDADFGETHYRLGIINPPPTMTLPEGAEALSVNSFDEAKEREMFEKAYEGYNFSREWSGIYKDERVANRWNAWLTRARIAAKE